MIRLEHTVLPSPEQMDFIIEGMRNPMNSWEISDSRMPCKFGDADIDICESQCDWMDRNCVIGADEFMLGDRDHDLMKRLAKAGTDHRKYMRMMVVYVRVTAPLYWWKEFDTYKIGTVSNSCSTMHKIMEKEFTINDFSCEHLLNMTDNDYVPLIDVSPYGDGNIVYTPSGALTLTIEMLNKCRLRYLTALKTEEECGIPAKDIWWQVIQLLPSSYNQTRNIMLNYEVLTKIYKRKNHKLDEWRRFCKWIEGLPYSELITGIKED